MIAKINRMFLGTITALFILASPLMAQHTVENFSLKNGENQDVWLKDIAKNKKAAVVILTSSNCVFAVKYEQRLEKLYESFSDQDVAFLAVNSNDPSMSQRDALARISDDSPFKFPYLKDANQKVATALQATRNPEAFILVPKNGSGDTFTVVYQGKIDDNPLDEQAASVHFLEDALKAVVSGGKPAKAKVPANGCPIKWIR